MRDPPRRFLHASGGVALPGPAPAHAGLSHLRAPFHCVPPAYLAGLAGSARLDHSRRSLVGIETWTGTDGPTRLRARPDGLCLVSLPLRTKRVRRIVAADRIQNLNSAPALPGDPQRLSLRAAMDHSRDDLRNTPSIGTVAYASSPSSKK